jgi:hypothetical protein
MPTSRKQFSAARLAKLHPDLAYQRELAMTVAQRKALYAEIKTGDYFRLYCDITARHFVQALNDAVREDMEELARTAPQREAEAAARGEARS